MKSTWISPATPPLLAPCSKLHDIWGEMPDMPRCLKINTNFPVLLTAICLVTSMHTKGFTPKSSRHLYCWPASQDSNKHHSKMCASCPTGTSGLSSMTHFNVLDLELVSPFNMQSHSWEKGYSTKYMALGNMWSTLRQGMLTHCYLCFCSFPTF